VSASRSGVDIVPLASMSNTRDTVRVSDTVRTGREAFGRRQWATAYQELSAARSSASTADDLDRLAVAAFLAGRAEESFALWASAHHRSVDGQHIGAAARYGLRLAAAVGFLGDIPRSRGWVFHTQRLLDEAGYDGVERGYLAHGSAMCRIFDGGDIDDALMLFDQAAKIGERFADPDLVTSSRISVGRCLIYLGELAEGVAMLDEAMVRVESAELSALIAGDAYCTVIDAANEIFDLARFQIWTESFRAWCDAQPQLVLFRGHCHLHCAELLRFRGDWAGSLVEATRAVEQLTEPRNLLSLGGAHYVKAELHRLRGDLDAAEHEYQLANREGCSPFPGLAQLWMSQGLTEEAAKTFRRLSAETNGAVSRARLLPHLVQAALALDDPAWAGSAIDELAALAARLNSPYLLASADTALGQILLAEGQARDALNALRRGCARWLELGAPYEAACARIDLASACRLLGDANGAEVELDAARAALEGMGVAVPVPQAAAGNGRSAAPVGGLTTREVEVLAHLALGKSNRTIASDLFISEKTVASHVSHIFTKLGFSTRTEAARFAYQHGLTPMPDA
jgi:DNA-binding NarL/FixJ family response regulator